MKRTSQYSASGALVSILFVVAFLGACSGDSVHHVDVELSTSLTPGVDFTWVDTDITTYEEGRPGQIVMREQLRARYDSERAVEWARGIQIAGFDSLPTGSYVVRVVLRSVADDAIVSQEAFVEVFEDTLVRIRIDRGCLSAECPSAGGSAALSACRQASCVDPGCDPTDLATRDELCPSVVFCDADADCEAPASECAAALCIDGTCIEAPASADVCPAGEYCDPRLGCRSLGDPLPECGTLCDLRNDDCAFGYWNCDISPPRCDAVSSAPTGTMCLRGDETAGACDPRGACVECVEGAPCTVGCFVGIQECGESGLVCNTEGAMVVEVGTACTQPSGRMGYCDETGGCGGCPVGGCTEEVCNGLDDDMDGEIDEDASDQVVFYTDTDGDGFGAMALDPMCDRPDGTATVGGDCDDEDRERFPGAPTFCNGADDDCDGNSDEDVPTWYVDADGDGVGGAVAAVACAGPDGSVATGGDCDDASNTIYPGAPEICDGDDNNCVGGVDEGDPGGGEACGSSVGACTMGALRCAGGALVCVGGVRPSAEVCDGVDNNCDGQPDDGNPGGGSMCDPDGACETGTEECLDGGLVCSPGAECDCTPNLPCALSNPCERMGRTSCATGVSVCVGVPRDDGDACGLEDVGAWGRCGGFDGTCDETGTQARVAIRPACLDGVCNSDPIDESQACRRDRRGFMCAESTTADPGPCVFMTCQNDGGRPQVRTDFTCRDGSCNPQNTTEYLLCERDAEGISCGDVVVSDWSVCTYASTCATAGTQQQTTTTPVCASEMCDMQMETVSRACGPRVTRGMTCEGPDEGPWGDCVPNSTLCATTGVQAREVTRVVCSAGACSNMIVETETEACEVPSDGTSCGDPTYGEWSECEYPDQCRMRGERSRDVLRPTCEAGMCGLIRDVETEPCSRETERARCAMDQADGWTECMVSTCRQPAEGAEYHFDDGRCIAEVCERDDRGYSRYGVSRPCEVPVDLEGQTCSTGCGVGRCEAGRCGGAIPPRCGDGEACCGEECIPSALMCSLKM